MRWPLLHLRAKEGLRLAPRRFEAFCMSCGGSDILAGTGTDDPGPLCVVRDGAATLCESFGDLDDCVAMLYAIEHAIICYHHRKASTMPQGQGPGGLLVVLTAL